MIELLYWNFVGDYKKHGIYNFIAIGYGSLISTKPFQCLIHPIFIDWVTRHTYLRNGYPKSNKVFTFISAVYINIQDAFLIIIIKCFYRLISG